MSKKHYRKRITSTRRRRAYWPPLAVIAVGVLVLGGVVWAAKGGPTASTMPIEVTGSPRLKADQQRADLGNIRLGRTVEVTFQLANVGDQPLRFAEAPFVTVAEGC